MSRKIVLTEETRQKARKSRNLANDPDALVDSMRLGFSEKRMTKVRRTVAEMPARDRRLYLRGIKGKGNAPAALRSFCGLCVGNVRDDITNCTALDCPLYSVRPYQSATTTTTNPTPPVGRHDTSSIPTDGEQGKLVLE